jgi:hypothetical protein
MDFNDFLKLKGCVVGKHTTIPQKLPDVQPLIEPQVLKTPELEKYDVSIPLPATIPKTPKVQIKEADLFDPPNCVVNVGTNCKRKGCDHIYADGSKDTECHFHAGEPIFHEGLKGWTCCTFILKHRSAQSP